MYNVMGKPMLWCYGKTMRHEPRLRSCLEKIREMKEMMEKKKRKGQRDSKA